MTDSIATILSEARKYGLDLVIAHQFISQLTGKGGERRITSLGPWRWVMLGYTMLVLSLSVLLPYVVLAQAIERLGDVAVGVAALEVGEEHVAAEAPLLARP